MKTRNLLVLCPLALSAPAMGQNQYNLNEIYVSHVGLDDQEYIEVVGTPGAPVDDLMILVVEGDGAVAGTLDSGWSCPPPQLIPPDGYMVVGDAGVTNVDLVVGNSDILENGTQTIYLICADAATQAVILNLVGSDVDPDDDGITLIAQMATVVIKDIIAVTDGDAGDVVYDGAQVIGPDGPFLPAGIYRPGDFPDPWCTTSYLDFDDALNANVPRTPGSTNFGNCPPVSFAGLDHLALGQASVSARDRLVVSNIGSSGCDGVSIDLGEAEYQIIELEELPAPTLPDGSWVEVVTVGDLNGVPNSQIWSVRLEDRGSDYGLSMDTTSVGSLSMQVDALLGGQVVSTRSYAPAPPPGQPVAIVQPGIYRVDPFWQMGGGQCIVIVELDNPGQVTVVGNSAVLADSLVLHLENPGVSVGSLSRHDVRAADIPTFTILDEALGMFHHNHTALGQAQFDAGGGHLTISNIGSSGKDGVSIFDPTPLSLVGDGLYLLISDPDPTDTLPTGSQLVFSATGTGPTGSGQPLGQLICNDNGTNVELIPDYSAVGSSTSLVELYLHGVRVFSQSGMTGTVAITPDWPGGCGKRPGWYPWSFPCFAPTYPAPVPVTIPGGPTILADEIRILAEGSQFQYDALDRLAMHGNQVPAVTLIGEGESSGYRGLTNTSTGNAAPLNRNGQLVVSNIGSSGCDGVRIDLGEAEYALIEYCVPPAGLLPDGSFVEFSIDGLLNGNPAGDLWSLRVEDIGAEFGVSLDTTGVSAGGLRVESRLDGQPVSSTDYSPAPAPGQVLSVFPPATCMVDPIWPMGVDETWAIIELDSPQQITVVGNPPALADEVVFIAAGTRTVDAVSRVHVTGTDVGEIEIFDEALGKFHNAHRGLGQAQMQAGHDHLTISNIGSSGKDGVSIDIGPSGGFDMQWEPIDPSGLLTQGAKLAIAAKGTAAGAAVVSLGSICVEHTGSDLEVTPDYSPVGSATALLELYLQGQIVFSQSGMTGPVARAPLASWPGGCGKRPRWEPFPFPCFALYWPGSLPITVSGGPTVLADEIRVLAEGATQPFDALVGFDVQLTDIPQLVITQELTYQETLGTPLCFGVGCPCGNDDPAAGCKNSSNVGGLLAGSGSVSVGADDLVLTATQLPPTNSGLFYMGDTVVNNPFFDGKQCALGTTLRFLCCIQTTGAGGVMTLGPGVVSNSAGLIVPGSTWYFHAWHRDASPGPGPCGTGANLTHLLGLTFAP